MRAQQQQLRLRRRGGQQAGHVLRQHPGRAPFQLHGLQFGLHGGPHALCLRGARAQPALKRGGRGGAIAVHKAARKAQRGVWPGRGQRCAQPRFGRGEHGQRALAAAKHHQPLEGARAQKKRGHGPAQQSARPAGHRARGCSTRAAFPRAGLRQHQGGHGGVQRGLAHNGLAAQALLRRAPHKRPQLLHRHGKAAQRKANAARIHPGLLAVRALQRAQKHIAVPRGKHGGRAAQAPGLKQAFFLIQRAADAGRRGALHAGEQRRLEGAGGRILQPAGRGGLAVGARRQRGGPVVRAQAVAARHFGCDNG